ncbi:heart- and neural crest derivatives-expressed protein 2 [Callorhinchus milii]|uniref:BHLH domain-containing protein n=1 Tax=Callorhinchus milii TaxID=7868 RepID=A0A4W3H768_CALMI|nr:heart- and neural crest derivatives-expressed protein 2 [Callorhinchus milii]|eukprot:gi/632979118/ref/XP_007906292.1/ PREDICTED: heart- and neural crest derivatives-expressed protein 1 [Callorhinchus milii]
MSLVGGFQHHPLMHEGFPFATNSRCHQDHPFFQSWVLNQGELSPDYPGQPSYSPDYGISGSAQEPGRFGAVADRPGRRRGTAIPKKERRRTESINSAFAELRECIPNVPADTKLSKIKTLRLATSYIAYLMDLLAKDTQNGETEAFKADLKKIDSKEGKRKREMNEIVNGSIRGSDKKMKGRTGWPQQVWALELNQ